MTKSQKLFCVITLLYIVGQIGVLLILKHTTFKLENCDCKCSE